MVLQLPLRGLKWRFRDGMDSRVAGMAPPAASPGVGVDGIELHRVANASYTFRGRHCRATAREPVQDEIAAGGTVQNRVPAGLPRASGRLSGVPSDCPFCPPQIATPWRSPVTDDAVRRSRAFSIRHL